MKSHLTLKKKCKSVVCGASSGLSKSAIEFLAECAIYFARDDSRPPGVCLAVSGADFAAAGADFAAASAFFFQSVLEKVPGFAF